MTFKNTQNSHKSTHSCRTCHCTHAQLAHGLPASRRRCWRMPACRRTPRGGRLSPSWSTRSRACACCTRRPDSPPLVTGMLRRSRGGARKCALAPAAAGGLSVPRPHRVQCSAVVARSAAAQRQQPGHQEGWIAGRFRLVENATLALGPLLCEADLTGLPSGNAPPARRSQRLAASQDGRFAGHLILRSSKKLLYTLRHRGCHRVRRR